MIRVTPEATYVWRAFYAGAGVWRKITWPMEIFLLHEKTARKTPEISIELWDAGEISELTERDHRELDAARPFESEKHRAKAELERTKLLSTEGGNRNGGLPVPEYSKAAGAE